MKPKAQIAELDPRSSGGFTPSLTLWQRALLRIRQDKQTLAAMFVLFTFAAIGLTAPIISDIFDLDPIEQDLRHNYAPFGTEGHILGTDELGRDHLARLLFAGQITFGIAIAASIVSLGIGVTIGAIAGYYRGLVDDFIIWFIATLDSIPFLFLLIIISAVLSPSPYTMTLIFGILSWSGLARLVRAETISIKERDYVLAARAIGAPDRRVMFLHIVPNIFSLLIIIMSQAIGGLILAESALSFIGFGIRPPTPTWGNMLNGALDYMRRAPHLMLLPGMLITITVFCLYVIGDGLRDAFDPKIAD